MEENQSPNEVKTTKLSRALIILIVIVIGFIGYRNLNLSSKEPQKQVIAEEQIQDDSVIKEENVLPQHMHDAVKTPLNPDEVKAIISQYLNDHPEAVMDALRKLEVKAIAEKTKNTEDFLAKNFEKLTSDRPFIGNKQGKITVIKFFDYKCGYCKQSHLVLERIIKENPEVKVYLENTPILGPNSQLASKASIAFWLLSPQNFSKFNSDLINISDINKASLIALAKKYGVNEAAFSAKMDSSVVTDKLNENLKIAQQVGVQGVPAFIVNGKLIPGSLSYEEFKSRLDEISKPSIEKTVEIN